MITWWGKRPKLLAFIVLGGLVAVLAGLAALAGFGNGYVPNFLLNAACDMLGGLTILFLVDPIIRSAAIGIRAHPFMSSTRFTARVAASTDVVRILDTASRMIREDAEEDNRLLEAVRSATENGAFVKVLLMNPSSDASRARDAQLRDRHPDFDLDRMINRTITQLQRIQRELGELGSRVELRVYSSPVPFILYGADSSLLYTIVPHSLLVDDAPQVEVRAETELGRHLLTGFNTLWESARGLDELIKVRFAEQPGDVPMLMRHIEHESVLYLVSSRIDRVYEYQNEPRFLLGDDSSTVYRAVPVTFGTNVYNWLLDALQDRYPRSVRRADRRFYRVVKDDRAEQAEGRLRAFQGLPAVHLTSLIGVAGREVRIFDTCSSLLVEDAAGPDQVGGPVLQATLDALDHGAHLKALLMYPGTAFSRNRTEEIAEPHVESRIEQNLRWLTELRDQAARHGLPSDRVQVRLYNAQPSFSVYQVDDTVIAGFMPMGTRSSGATHYSTELDTPLAGFVLDQFDLLWHQGPADHVHQFESLEFMTIEAPRQSVRILARAWKSGGEWFVCSARVDDLLDQHGEDLPIAFDRWPGRSWWLPKVLGNVEFNQARDTFVRRFGVIPQDARLRQVVPLR
ncbi:hypothetical protein [Actinospica sp.]|uniref:hypothetical protein n=1 Tax=Actinospica sp. TaxID=1872142 RepID=UPI002CFF9D34|nr:hypothetical protein [Actinospica sp.]HWG28530.1 hypothetical protein [Actinospica sp.]